MARRHSVFLFPFFHDDTMNGNAGASAGCRGWGLLFLFSFYGRVRLAGRLHGLSGEFRARCQALGLSADTTYFNIPS